ncbi:DUF1559 domain-containing protein [Blastopirellula sp. J2-11]|uniref:DUF1559 domain-containing protein n=1 Tax=Blastopirellula sp. J2-11 TaxID=2943192 RepID=UPI0021C78C07|nr:DUF1559 domain-containing protein [Blastopirellula sp. J2-11]UUO07805.1 DUF1559 domain-containing protein [Blastopirellula sp. J2-11]
MLRRYANITIRSQSFRRSWFTNDAGESLHSWRVLILPQIEANSFYELYDFESAWNSKTNVDLRDGTRQVDGVEPDAVSNAGRIYLPDDSPHMLETIFVAMVNGHLLEKDIWLSDVKLTGHYLPKGQPFVVLEIQYSGIHWMEPRDVSPPMQRFPDWININEVKDQIVRSIEIGAVTQMRDHDETLAYLDSLRHAEE